jgi:hypothetical protein
MTRAWTSLLASWVRATLRETTFMIRVSAAARLALPRCVREQRTGRPDRGDGDRAATGRRSPDTVVVTTTKN